MAFKFIIFVATFAIVHGDFVPSPTYGAPATSAKFTSPIVVGELTPAVSQKYHEYVKYSYAYGVDDKSTGDQKQHQESRDGDVVKGSYSLVEADGSLRTVHYTADGNGFMAYVDKSGNKERSPAVSAPYVAKSAAQVENYYDNYQGQELPREAGPVTFATYGISEIEYGVPESTPAPAYLSPVTEISVQVPHATYGVPSEEPHSTYEAPVQKPQSTYGTPTDISVQVPQTSYGVPAEESHLTYDTPIEQPHTTYGAPAQKPLSTYGTPVETPSVQVPQTTYGVPAEEPHLIYDTSVEKPHRTYGTPSQGSAQVPHSTYGAPAQSSFQVPHVAYGAPFRPSAPDTKVVSSAMPHSVYGTPAQVPHSTYGTPFKPSVADTNVHKPSSSYATPSTSYGAPSSSYGVPSNSYGVPSASYGAPSTSYGVPSSTKSHSYPSYLVNKNVYNQKYPSHRAPVAKFSGPGFHGAYRAPSRNVPFKTYGPPAFKHSPSSYRSSNHSW